MLDKDSDLTTMYQLAVLGSPTDEQVRQLEELIAEAVKLFGLRLGQEVSWEVCPTDFSPEQQKSAAVVYYGGIDAPTANIDRLLRTNIPILPVVSDSGKVETEIPEQLRPFNCLAYKKPHYSCSTLSQPDYSMSFLIHTVLHRQKTFRLCFGIAYVIQMY